MVNKCATPKCTSGYASNEKKQIAKFNFPLKNTGSTIPKNKQWIHFISGRDWPTTRHTVLSELYFEGKYLRRGGKCTLEWSMNPVPTAYSQTLSSKPALLLTQQTTCSLPRKRSFPDELLTFQQRDIVRTFQHLNKSIVPACFQFIELDICVSYFHFIFDGDTKFPRILKFIKVNDDFQVYLQSNGRPLPLPQWFAQGHNETPKKVCYLEPFPAIYKTPPPSMR